MSDALAAALLATQRRRVDPLDQQRKYAQLLMQQGGSTDPVRTPLAGLARSLTGGIGGALEGLTDRQEKAHNAKTSDKLGRMLAATSPDEIAKIAQEPGGDMDILAPVMSQAIAERQKTMHQGTAADAFTAANRPPPPGTQTAGGPQPMQGLPVPLPQGDAPPGALGNNVGNIRATPIAWPGKGVPQNGFETFSTPQAGVNAAFQNLGAYVQQNPNITVAEAIAKWAPPNENNTQQYISQVAEGTGINPGMRLSDVLKDPAVGAQFLDAMTRKEKGGLPQGVTADTFMNATAPNGQASPVQLAQGDAIPRADASGTPVAPQPSTIPDVPRPTASPDQIKKYEDMIRSGGMTPAQARQALDQEVTQEWTVQRENRRMQEQQNREDQRAKTKAETELNQKAPLELITKRIDNYETKLRPTAMAAVNEIPVIHQTRQALDAGAFTGTGAEAKTFLSKIGEQLGIPSDAAVNTQVLGSMLAKRTLAAAGGTLGTGFSNADRDFMALASGGSATLDEGAIRKILDIGERSARQTIKSHDTEAARLKKLPGMDGPLGEQFQLPDAPDYKAWSAANPPLQGQGAPPPAPSAPPPASGGAQNIPTLNSPEEAAKLPRGTQFKTPDGRLKVVP